MTKAPRESRTRPASAPARPLIARPRPGWTLVELMIVMAMLAILLTILLPVLSGLREKAHEVACQNNLRQMSSAFFNFAADHGRRLPGGSADNLDPDPAHEDWLMGNPHDFSTAPQGGTLFPYINSHAVFRCPSLDVNPPKTDAVFGPFSGSNGRFDYAALQIFSGARVESIPAVCRLLYPDGTLESRSTPLLVEKDATFINGAQLNGSHQSNFTMSHHHHGGSFYATVEGSAQWVNEPPGDPHRGGCQLWEGQAPSSRWVQLGPILPRWGFWDRQ